MNIDAKGCIIALVMMAAYAIAVQFLEPVAGPWIKRKCARLKSNVARWIEAHRRRS
jgi:hypothetical protein